MTRFTSALINVSKKGNLAELLQQHLIVFLNSVLVEETKEKFGEKIELNNNNPTDKNTLFIDNLNKVMSVVDKGGEENVNYMDSLNLTHCLLSCPLIIEFFNKSTFDEVNDYNKFSSVITEHYSTTTESKTLFEVLSNSIFKTQENSTIDKIDIKKDQLDKSLKCIIDETGVEFFRTNIYDIEDNREAYKVLKNLPFVNSVGRGCAKKLKELFKRKYIDKQ